VIATVLLVPAIIWSGMIQGGTRTPKDTSKIPGIETAGPDMTPYVMTAQERAKTQMPAWNPPDGAGMPLETEPRSTIGSTGPYPGMTQAELDKFAQWQASAKSLRPGTATQQTEPFATIENIPRPPDVDGLTPQERAKLAAYLKNQNR
jgi:hypothetical protein